MELNLTHIKTAARMLYGYRQIMGINAIPGQWIGKAWVEYLDNDSARIVCDLASEECGPALEYLDKIRNEACK